MNKFEMFKFWVSKEAKDFIKSFSVEDDWEISTAMPLYGSMYEWTRLHNKHNLFIVDWNSSGIHNRMVTTDGNGGWFKGDFDKRDWDYVVTQIDKIPTPSIIQKEASDPLDFWKPSKEVVRLCSTFYEKNRWSHLGCKREQGYFLELYVDLYTNTELQYIHLGNDGRMLYPNWFSKGDKGYFNFHFKKTQSSFRSASRERLEKERETFGLRYR